MYVCVTYLYSRKLRNSKRAYLKIGMIIALDIGVSIRDKKIIIGGNMNIRGKETGFILLIGLLWVGITLSGWTGYWFYGLLAGVVLMFLHMVLGAAQKGVVSLKLLLYTLVSWLAVWIIGFILTQRYAVMFLNQQPSFSILGFHPSFAFIVIFYWIGGVLTLNLGYIKFSEEWLSTKNWDEFVEKVKKIDASKEAA